MRETGARVRRNPIGRQLLAVMLVMLCVLSLLVAVSIGQLYESRQNYENELAASYRVETETANLLTTSVAEQAALQQNPPTSPVVVSASEAFDAQRVRTVRASSTDDESFRLASQLKVLQGQLRFARESVPADVIDAERAKLQISSASADLSARQQVRRVRAQESAKSASRSALLLAALLGAGVILIATFAVVRLVGSMREPFHEVVDITDQVVAGKHSSRAPVARPQNRSRSKIL